MSRINNVLKNARVGLIFLPMTTLLTFISRQIFIEHLGEDFVGLTSVLGNSLALLSVAELGLGVAVTSSLYKPLATNNKERIIEIVSLLGYFYKLIAYVGLVFGVAGSYFLLGIIEGTDISYLDALTLLLCLLASVVIDYYFNYKQTIFNADQRLYLIVKYTQLTNIFKLIIQIGALVYCESILAWCFSIIITSVLNSILINKAVRKYYSWLKIRKCNLNTLMSGNVELFRNIKQLFIHKIAGFVYSSSDTLLIYHFVNLTQVTLVANYQLIVTQIVLIYKTAFSGIHPSVGDFIAREDTENIVRLFKELNSLRWMFATICSICLYLLLDDFILIWLKGDFVLEASVKIMIIAIFFVTVIRSTIDNFIIGYGLFSDTKAPIVEVLINIGISVILGHFIGVAGVLLGTFISVFTVVYMWRSFYLYKKKFYIHNYKDYIYMLFKNLALLVSITCLSFVAFSSLLNLTHESFLLFLQNSVIVFLGTTFITVLINYAFDLNSRGVINRILFKIVKRNH
ncbi:lipopolysaccharide biosynthesis protein [Endozoicomonas acroporae]|uniref:lipopolysaccharide biosynthesis protein n=1 Tax=Endozoicomonas acroporae TaxID=1701104 RepID=UPI003D791341